MIVLKTPGSASKENTTAPLFVIRETDSYFEISRVGTGADVPMQKVSKDSIPEDGRVVYFWSHYGFGLVPALDYDDARDSAAFYSTKYGCPEGAVMTIARRGSTCVLVATAYCHAESDFVIRQVPGPSIELVDEFIPGFSATARAKKSRAKMELVRHLNPLDSLAALEKQVDLLTMLVLSLARKQPAAEQPAWLDELETVFNDTSSVQEDALEKAVASMGEYKSHIRALQDVYFRAKNG